MVVDCLCALVSQTSSLLSSPLWGDQVNTNLESAAGPALARGHSLSPKLLLAHARALSASTVVDTTRLEGLSSADLYWQPQGPRRRFLRSEPQSACLNLRRVDGRTLQTPRCAPNRRHHAIQLAPAGKLPAAGTALSHPLIDAEDGELSGKEWQTLAKNGELCQK